jgi:hypothetical protein
MHPDFGALWLGLFSGIERYDAELHQDFLLADYILRKNQIRFNGKLLTKNPFVSSERLFTLDYGSNTNKF